MSIWEELKRPRRIAWPTAHGLHHWCHGCEKWAHRVYCGLVFMEGHSYYAYAALAILLADVGSIFFPGEEV